MANNMMTSTELYTMVSEYNDLKAEIERLQNELEYMRVCIADQMTARETDKLEIGPWTVSNTLVVSNRLDAKALRAAEPELAEQFTKACTYHRFTVA